MSESLQRVAAIATGGAGLLFALTATQDVVITAVVAACFVVMGLLSLYLPYGELTSIDGAISATAIVLVGPLVALLLTLSGRLIAAGVASRGSLSQTLPPIGSRALAMLIAAGALFVARAVAGPMEIVIEALVVAVVLVSAEFALSQAHSARGLGRSYRSLLAGNALLLGPLFAAEVSSSVLAVMLFPEMKAWSIVLVLLLLLLIRQSYSMLFEIRGAYRQTVEVLVDAAESMGSTRHGHAEATARIAHDIGVALGLRGGSLERVVYAALLHDIDLVGDSSDSKVRGAGRVLADVHYLADVVPVLRICDGDQAHASSARIQELEAAFVVSLASDIDEMLAGGTPVDVQRVASIVPSSVRGRVTGTALTLGMPVPAQS